VQHRVAEEAGWRFEICDGPNLGAIVTLAPGRYRLGSDALNDIVLADASVAPEQAVMELTRDRASITAFAPGVQLRQRRLDNGRHYMLKPGIVITLGATRVRVTAPPGLSQRHWSGNLALCVATVAAACTGAAYYFGAPTAVGATPPGQPATASASTMTLAQAATDFRAHLADMHVAPDVQVTESDGIVLATGTIMPQDRTAWLDAEKWFDGHLGGRFALADHVGTPTTEELPKLDVAAVSMAPVPNVITRDGEHYTVGAVLRDGWSIDRIAPDAVTLRSGAREIRVNL
jgi:hypothetical protein